MCMQIENMQYLNPLHSKERFLNATTLCQNRCSLGVNNSQNGLTAPKQKRASFASTNYFEFLPRDAMHPRY